VLFAPVRVYRNNGGEAELVFSMEVLISYCSSVVMAQWGKSTAEHSMLGAFPQGVGVGNQKSSVTRNEFATSLQRWWLSNFLNCILPKFHTSVPRESGMEGALNLVGPSAVI
jgi:hypothetical protein